MAGILTNTGQHHIAGNSDCILIESNGHFALIDSGEGDENPRKTTEYEGYKDEVLTYIKKVARNKSGEVYIDFILGTHNHYDHIGCFYDIINDDAVFFNDKTMHRWLEAD